MKGQDKLLISARREEENPTNRLSASLTREFDLTEKVVPQSLKAGLTMDGVLKITATVDRDVNVNGGVTSGNPSQESRLNGKVVNSPGVGLNGGGAATMNGAKTHGL